MELRKLKQAFLAERLSAATYEQQRATLLTSTVERSPQADDSEALVSLLRDLPVLLTHTTNAERRTVLQQLITEVYTRQKAVIAFRPTRLAERLFQAAAETPAWRDVLTNSGDGGPGGYPAATASTLPPIRTFEALLQTGSGRALISRYFTRPLLDLTDIGVYAIGLRAEVTPTPRLQHLELCSEAGMLPLPDTLSLLAQAAAGALTTCAGNATVAIHLSVHGYARLGLRSPVSDQPTYSVTEQPDGSPHGSGTGSRDQAKLLSDIVDQEASKCVADVPESLIAWDVGMIHESINHDSAADHVRSGGERSHGRDAHQSAMHALREPDVAVSTDHLIEPPLCNVPPTALDGAVVAGHRVLNPERTLHAGEWLELLILQSAHGAEQLLIWQARAGRSIVKRPFGVTPAYYHACAARATCAIAPAHVGCRTTAKAVTHEQNDARQVGPALDPRCNALLKEMGVREPQTLAATPPALIEAWSEIIAHPGLLARFDSPVGFAVRQMCQGQMPPTSAELDRWAKRAARSADCYQTWRHIDAPPCQMDSVMQEQSLELRVRALAPRDADISELCALATWIEQGATDQEALAKLAAGDRGEVA